MKMFCRLLAIALVLVMTAATAFAFASRPPEVHGQKRYGIIVEMPKDRIGFWNIAGKRVEATKETYIDEQRGKAEPGAFVEATGKEQGNIFRAYRIEVKLPKKERP
jgi:ABC-type sugar transport system substrate-binding protein